MAVRPYPSFLIYLDNADEFRWRFQTANHKTTADGSEGYNNYADCRAGILLLKSPHPIWRTQEVVDRLG
jgi:uncharacterized protein YegP (UPF0339 family)